MYNLNDRLLVRACERQDTNFRYGWLIDKNKLAVTDSASEVPSNARHTTCLTMSFVFIKPDTIGQSTCRLDKNKNLIFEGDFVQTELDNDTSFTGIVKYGLTKIEQYSITCFWIDWFIEPPIKSTLRIEFDFWVDETGLEVIGNTINNPEPMVAKTKRD